MRSGDLRGLQSRFSYCATGRINTQANKIGCVYRGTRDSHDAQRRSEMHQIAKPTDTTTDTGKVRHIIL
jgi:hypothetical protein